MSEETECPKCGTKLGSDDEFLKHAEGLVESGLLDFVLEVDTKSWEKEVLESDLVVVEFWHESCPVCKSLAPIYGRIAEEFKDKIKFARLNVLASKENRDLAVKYGVMSTPTLIFFCKRKPITTKVGGDGFETEHGLKKLIDDVVKTCTRNNE